MIIRPSREHIPQNPGVYWYKNKRGGVLYVGKAGNLRARLRSYFLKNAPNKAKALVQEADTLSWEIVGSEVEALIREAELIKKYRPRYNVLMRDDKQYFFVGFTREKFPRIFLTHSASSKQGLYHKIDRHPLYLGPFTDGNSLKMTLKLLRRILPYCTCKNAHQTSCLNAKIGRCPGYCCAQNDASNISSRSPHPAQRVGLGVSRREDMLRASYGRNIAAIKKILLGKNKTLLSSLKKEMQSLSQSRRYEEAAQVRDQMYALERIFQHQNVIKKDMPSDRSRALHALASILKTKHIERIEGYDISNIHGHFAYGSMVVFQEGLPQKDAYRIFKIKKIRGSDDPAMIREIITRRLQHPEWPYPDVMLIDGGPTQLNAARKAQNNGFVSAANTKIISLAKREEELYLPNQKNPIKIKQSSETLYALLTHIRNEAHRFAISHYRRLHRNTLTKT